MTNNTIITGYKVFLPDFTCREHQFSENSEHQVEGKPELCHNGFHFCPKANDCFQYYDFDSDNIVCEVQALGPIDGLDTDGNPKEDKLCTTHIRIGRRLSWHEVLGVINSGKGNSGRANTGNLNTGDRNTGNRNTGDRNTGNLNTGNRNTGDRNTGNRNTGDRNTGNWNTGNRNTGDWNTGDWNTGDWNTGDRNTGNWNTGNRNTGDWNTGDRNTGNLNTGNLNTGNLNTGNRNTGDRNTGNLNTGNLNTGNLNTGNLNTGNLNTGNLNTGNRNTGDWNTGDDSTGVFCTDSPEILLFDKPSGFTRSQWRDTEAAYLMRDVVLTRWISWSDMTDEEKTQFPRAETQEGYLKRFEYKAAHATWWSKLDARQRSQFTSLKNFSAEKFQQITGIDINA